MPAHEPDLSAEPGWTELSPRDALGQSGSFVCGEPEGQRLRVRYFVRDADGVVVGKAWFGPGAQGPPAHAHGGALAAVLDEAMGAAAWSAGHYVLCVELTTRFHRRLPLGTTARIEARVERVEGRKVYTRAVISDAAGQPFCEGEALNIALNEEQLAKVELTTLMASWKAWAERDRNG